ncbi:hypothetical protein ASF43_29430 [Pseudorhodoferax sp. Leaf267]|nr:hypothetical protein ASF43_29430 [Pseudorhodoferax sp. Leaf267]
MLGWLAGFVVPVLALSVAGRSDGVAASVAVTVAFCMLLAVYAAYEVGYLVNDVLVTTRETHPTHRLPQAPRMWYAERLGRAAAARFVMGAAVLGCAAAAAGSLRPMVLLGWLALWPVFALYNHWRGRVTIVIYLVLNGLRFVVPVWAGAGADPVLPPWPAWLLLYAAPNTYIAAWKPRYRLQWLAQPFASEAQFRFIWHAAVAAVAVVVAVRSDAAATLHFAAVASWILLVRLVAFTPHRHAA